MKTQDKIKEVEEEIEDKIIKKIHNKYYDKNEGYESGYVEDYIRDAIKQTLKFCSEEITKLKEENKLLPIKMNAEAKRQIQNIARYEGRKEALEEQTAKVEKLKEEINERNLYNISKNNLKVIKGFIDEIFSQNHKPENECCILSNKDSNSGSSSEEVCECGHGKFFHNNKKETCLYPVGKLGYCCECNKFVPKKAGVGE